MTMTAVRERPVLFSGPMVRAILEGRKTQTRRVARPQREHGLSRCHYSATGWAIGTSEGGCTCCSVSPPYGDVGDRLWVREAFYDRGDYAAIGRVRRDRIVYVADGIKAGWKARPSIHMPRWASRITLEITGVRVERLQEINEQDAWDEGFHNPRGTNREYPDRARYWFRHLWDEINGKREGCGWDDNPWAWAISFRRVER